MYLLDTNVISELMKSQPDRNVLAWLKTIQLDDLYLSTLSIAEISRGIEKTKHASKKQRLQQALATIKHTFGARILEFDYRSATQFGHITARNEKQGLPMHPFDALLLAVVERYTLTMVTRNTKHFISRTALNIVNPFEGVEPNL